ncbi:MAG: PD-(D/E)XK nuclease family protein [Bacteroidota bacterium]
MTFLEQLVLQLKEEFGPRISELCLVVPSRRAVLFLRQALAQAYGRTIWAPKMVSIQDLLRELTPARFPDALPLVFELHQVYLARMRQDDPNFGESFEQFSAWGEMLLKDFDELDKYLVDARQLFTNIKELKEIDDFFTLEEENLKAVRTFWQSLRGGKEEPGEMQQRFLKIWQILFDVYQAFGDRLRSRNLAYDGMAYRSWVEKLAAGEELPFLKTVFIGFNALSTAEERIMGHLLKEEAAIVYWDVDYAYFTPPDEQRFPENKQGYIAGEEPGKFIREYHGKWKEWDSRLITHRMAAEQKDIRISGVPLKIGQAQYLGNLLRATAPPSESEMQEYAIVLAEEELLFSTLYALPPWVTQLNVTMGFRLRQTQIYHLLLTLMLMLNRLKVQEKELLFPYQEVLDLLNNPYLKSHHPQLSAKLQRQIGEQNLIFLKQSMFQKESLSPLLTYLFSPPPPPDALHHHVDISQLMAYLKQTLLLLLEDAQSRGAKLETEYIFHFYQWSLELEQVLADYQARLSLQGFTRLIRDHLKKLRIPFEGEPLVGVQLMGFLETRVLDFKHLYILSANEGNLPDTSTGNSFIPYNLRRGFGLPTYQEKDAIYAYHFYRLLQRAEEVHLIYNNASNSDSGMQEVSRFIRQIRHFFRDQPNLTPQEFSVSPQISVPETTGITIPQEPAIHQRLQQRFLGTPGRERAFSATALTTYITCPLRFYFRYVADIKEPVEVEEIMEANTFGSILHETLEALYGPLVAQGPLEPQILAQLPGKLSKALEATFLQHQLPWGKELTGKNYLLKGVIERFCRQILQEDLESELFQILSLEDDHTYRTRLEVAGEAFYMNGTFDRLDQLTESGVVRILDYKTGQVDIGVRDIETCFSDPKYKAAFQGFLYAWLYRRQFPEAQVQVGFYAVKTLKDGIQFMRKGAPIEGAILERFETLLRELIQQILREPFTQTEDEKRCSYCPYQTICQRG